MGEFLGVPLDSVNAVAGLVTAGSAAVAAWYAFRSLKAWRDEMLGRRKAEMAEETQAAAYKLREVIRWLRSPMAYGSEGATRHRDEREEEGGARYRDALFVPVERLRNEETFLAEFQSKKYRFMALFSEEAAKAYNDFLAVIREIQASSTFLIRDSYNEERSPSGLNDDAIARQQRHEEVIWWAGEDDAIEARVDSAIVALEATCRVAIMGQV